LVVITDSTEGNVSQLSNIDRSIRILAYFSFSGEGELILAACEKFIGGVVDPDEQFFGGVVDTGEKC
jgi:hypothetical protein